MAPKNDSSKAPKVAGSKPSTTAKIDSGSHSVGPTTQSKAKDVAQTSAQPSLLPKPNPAFGVDLPEAPPTLPSALKEKDGASTTEEKKDVETKVENPSLHSSMALEFTSEVHKDLEVDDSSSFDSTSSQSTPQSKLDAFARPGSPSAMDVMATGATTLEEQIAALTKLVEGLTKSMEDRDSELKDFILGTIKDKYNETPKFSSTYVIPYTRRINLFKMPTGYQPPKFQQFDGKGNPKQHIAHFVETCNNAETDGDLLVNSNT
ncbi:hypothetical protein Vadar_021840 [Vaccinium darrowii]|nr:hypothetical protein Vadar_021840 [Vaccinium darrowii]